MLVRCRFAGVMAEGRSLDMIDVEVRFFNSLTRYNAGQIRRVVTLPPSARVANALCCLSVPESEIFLALLNGRNIMRGFGCGSGIEDDLPIGPGDTLALSGPVPFSRGYGAAVV